MKRIYMFILSLFAILLPGLYSLFNGSFFGDDPYQYVIGARWIFTGFHSIYSYPYPLISTLYLPTIFMNNAEILWYSTLMSMILLFFLMISFYIMLRGLGYCESSSFIGSLVFSFSPPLLMEVGWGGQAQFLSFIFIFLSIYFNRKKYIFFILVFLSIISEPYTSIFGLAYLFLSFLIDKRINDIFYLVLSSISGIMLIYFISSHGSVIYLSPVIFHPSSLFPSQIPIIYVIAILALSTILLMILLREKSSFGERLYFLHLSLFTVASLFYILITPYILIGRITYFTMVPLALLFSITYMKVKVPWKKLIVISITIVFLALSYQGYLQDINYYSAPEYLAGVGEYINSNSPYNSTFLNVNIKNGWALEALSQREMYYGAINTTYVMYNDQLENVILGKIMSLSEYYYSSTNAYIMLNNGTYPFNVYAYSAPFFIRVLSLDMKNSTVGNKSIQNIQEYVTQNSIKIGNLRFLINSSGTFKISLISEKPACLRLKIENSTVSYSDGGIKIDANNGVIIILNGTYLKWRGSSLYINFTGNASFYIFEKFTYHYTDDLFAINHVKFAVLQKDDIYYSRFINDNDFIPVYKYEGIYIFEFRGLS